MISDGIDDLFELPTLYRTAREALELMMDRCFHGGNVCTVAQLRTPLLLKELEGRSDLIAKEIRELAAHDKKRTHSIAKRFIIICPALDLCRRPAMPFLPLEIRCSTISAE